MKLLTFAQADQDLYELAYVGLMAPDVRLVPAEMRAHGKLLDKFEAFGIKHEEKGRILNEGEEAKIVIEDTELLVLKKCCEGFPWNKAKSRRIAKLYDVLDAAEKAPDFKPDVPKVAAPAPAPAEADANST